MTEFLRISTTFLLTLAVFGCVLKVNRMITELKELQYAIDDYGDKCRRRVVVHLKNSQRHLRRRTGGFGSSSSGKQAKQKCLSRVSTEVSKSPGTSVTARSFVCSKKSLSRSRHPSSRIVSNEQPIKDEPNVKSSTQ